MMEDWVNISCILTYLNILQTFKTTFTSILLDHLLFMNFAPSVLDDTTKSTNSLDPVCVDVELTMQQNGH